MNDSVILAGQLDGDDGVSCARSARSQLEDLTVVCVCCFLCLSDTAALPRSCSPAHHVHRAYPSSAGAADRGPSQR
eukprot:scaffold35578_cov26-Tisochrysis_lutea.AAC.1